MPFLTPQYVGHKQGASFLLSREVTWEDDFMKEGQEMSKQYREEASQQRYLQGWKKAFDESKMHNCEWCELSVPDIDLTNIMVGVPMEIVAICSECLQKLEDEE